MHPCDQYSVTILRHLDHELTGRELEDFRSYLAACAMSAAGFRTVRRQKLDPNFS